MTNQPTPTIETRRDECRHGEFWTTYVVRDGYGCWRGDYTTWEAARAKVRSITDRPSK